MRVDGRGAGKRSSFVELKSVAVGLVEQSTWNTLWKLSAFDGRYLQKCLKREKSLLLPVQTSSLICEETQSQEIKDYRMN